MEHLTLVRPTQTMREALLDYRAEHFAQGETVLHGGALLERMEYEDWLRQTEENARPETVHSDWVVASTFAVVRREDGRIVGMADVRHTLNAFLRAYGGHIGVGVRPSERKKGYGVQILRLALAYARTLPLKQVMVACNRENAGSRAMILACGGRLEREFLYEDGSWVQVYWITL